jgi:hypothetical protein
MMPSRRDMTSANAIIVEEAHRDFHPITIPGMVSRSFDDAFSKENGIDSATATNPEQGQARC